MSKATFIPGIAGKPATPAVAASPAVPTVAGKVVLELSLEEAGALLRLVGKTSGNVLSAVYDELARLSERTELPKFIVIASGSYPSISVTKA